jgi:hypothetical protein
VGDSRGSVAIFLFSWTIGGQEFQAFTIYGRLQGVLGEESDTLTSILTNEP